MLACLPHWGSNFVLMPGVLPGFTVVMPTAISARSAAWLIDSDWLAEIYKQQKDLLDAEGLNTDALVELLGRACNLGFAVAEPAGWRLLPAVCRYLDHFEGLALAAKNDGDEANAPAEEYSAPEMPDDEESR